MRNVYFLLTITMIFVGSTPSLAQWSDGQNAEYVVGQPDFTTYSSGTATTKFMSPRGVAIDYTNNKLYVTDLYNHRVLRFAYPITGNQPTPERIFGTGSETYTQNTLPYPISAAVYNGTLWVANDRRISKFNNAHSIASDEPNADGVLGQSNYTSSTYTTSQSQFRWVTDISIDASGNMWVADYSSNRILKFNDVNSKANGANADLVLGQTDYTSNSGGTTQSKMYYPYGVDVNGTTVWVADASNNRVLRFDNPTTNGANANGVLGQSSYVTNSSGVSSTQFEEPYDVDVDAAGRLYVSDNRNARIMIFNDASNKANGGAADNVLGQTNFTTKGTTNGGQNRFYYNYDEEMQVYKWRAGNVTVDATNHKLLVTDIENNRVMVFAASSPLPVELTSFNATVSKLSVTLNWETATEVNNYGFEIERAAVVTQTVNSLAWNKIGFVPGGGNSNSPKSYKFMDKEISVCGRYCYRLKQIDTDGAYEYSEIVGVEIGNPVKFELKQNYPNPFNPSTMLKVTLPAEQFVNIEVYNSLGQYVSTLANGMISAGVHQIEFNAEGLSSGAYYAVVKAGENTSTIKMLLCK